MYNPVTHVVRTLKTLRCRIGSHQYQRVIEHPEFIDDQNFVNETVECQRCGNRLTMYDRERSPTEKIQTVRDFLVK